MSENEVVLKFDTWGSFGQYQNTLAILVDGTLLNPAKIYSGYGRNFTYYKQITVFGVIHKLLVEVNDSKKNRHVVVHVPAEIVSVVLAESKTSGGWKGFQILKGDGEITVEETQEVYIHENRKTITTYNVYYYVNGAQKIELRREEIKRETELVGKPKVIVKVQGDKIQIEGDTYHIKELLKANGFKWAPYDHLWVAEKQSINLQAVMQVLQQQAEVVQK